MPTSKEIERAIDGLVIDGRVERFINAAGEPSIRLLKQDKSKLTNDEPANDATRPRPLP